MSSSTAEGAAATAEFFMTDLYPHIYRTGDLTEWDVLSSPDCTFCNNMRSKITEMLAAEERVEAGAMSASNTATTEQREGTWYLVSTRLSQEDSTRIDSSGTPVSTTPGGTVDALIALSWDGGWHVDEVELTPAGA
ncbi:hypothetical protein Cfla_3306 [Cellulomonas flavigena DSM 20109]|uniref:DUF6318 domain-containing protein n=2 Tax=Cellulomonas flavigena TaxID=1711 RepID=D5UC26_CELFN|nr:hypothetical protein Cfla_3306 [Cellulomonas flavigena DSM 20109]